MTIPNRNLISEYYITEWHNSHRNENKIYSQLTALEKAAAMAALLEDTQPNNLNTGLSFANLDERFYNIIGQRWSNSVITLSTRWRGEDYTGYCIKVRRDSDDALADISFNPVTRNIDVEALLAHVGTGNGYVHTWYNQSSENSVNAVQATGANQPQIVFAGEVHWYGGQVAVKFGSPTFMALDTATNLGLDSETNNKTLFAKHVSTGSTDDAILSNYDSTPGTKQISLWSNKVVFESDPYLASAEVAKPTTNILRYVYGHYNATTGVVDIEVSEKNALKTVSTTGAPAAADFESTIAFHLGAWGDDTTAANYMDGYLTEIAVWNQAINLDFLIDN